MATMQHGTHFQTTTDQRLGNLYKTAESNIVSQLRK